ncbi:hypothetical protein B0O99DRAFT_616839 [Bisporella sp. PMI_857]|nr:hypothetical protein B0O99DRAFT_616839 [Bisporella sp. PMI_857]
MARESGSASGPLVMYEANNMGVQALRREITKGPTKMPFLVKDPLKTSARPNHYTSPSKPSYHAWDKIPSHWEHLVYLNLDTHNHRRIIAPHREIRAGAPDRGAMPKCFDKKEISASPAEFQWFALFPYDIAHIVWEYAAADESRREIRVEFEYGGL